MKNQIRVGLTTTRGKRIGNEDNYLVDGRIMNPSKDGSTFNKKCHFPVLLALSDGMGGSGQGKAAAFTALTTLNSEAVNVYQASNSDVLPMLDVLIKKASAAVFQLIHQGKEAGCTLAMAFIGKEEVVIANVGDSKVYQITDQKLVQLSVDHNLQQEMLNSGFAGSINRMRKNELTQYLGMSPKEVMLEPNYKKLDYNEMTLLLCSDGLTEVLGEDEIRDVYNRNQNKSLKKITQLLVEKALEQGSRDNISAMLIKLL